MGKGDKRSRRGKIFAGSYGKTRPKVKKKPNEKSQAEETTTKKKKEE